MEKWGAVFYSSCIRLSRTIEMGGDAVGTFTGCGYRCLDVASVEPQVGF
jgi:hypothetical protein